MSFFALDVTEGGAISCDVQQSFPEYECAIQLPDDDYTILLSKRNCDYYGSEVDDYICYHNPAPGFNVFGS